MTARARIAVPLLVALLGPDVGSAATDLADVIHRRFDTSAVASLIVVDFDADRDGDLVIAARGAARAIQLLRNDGTAGFTDVSAAALPPIAGDGFRVAAADLDRDGDVDLVSCAAPLRSRAGCHVLLNELAASGALRFRDATDAVGLSLPPSAAGHRGATGARSTPLLLDYDQDADVDLLLLPWDAAGSARVYRNDLDAGLLRFAPLGDDVLPVGGPIHHAAVVDERGAGTELYLSRSLRPDRFMVLDPDSGRYSDQSSARGLPRTRLAGGPVAAADFDGNGMPDLALHTGLFGLRLFLQDEDGRFHDRTHATSGLAGFEPLVAALIAVDFDRDRRPDILVQSSAFGPTRLLLNSGPGAGGRLRFRDATDAAGLQRVPFASAAAVYLDAEDCDHAVDLAVASAIAHVDGRLHRFPDDSAGRTIATSPGGGAAVASFAGACVQGSAGADRLIGHRTHSVLRGAGGDDTLIARAGLSVLAGGPGRDRFEAAGFTIVHLPPGDIVAGEIVDCAGADQVLIDSPLALDRLQAAGVVFEDCFEDAACTDEPSDGEEDEEPGFHCHEVRTPLSVANLDLGVGLAAMETGLGFGFTADYDFGFGDCEFSADCHAIGLDVCRTGSGDPTTPGNPGACYPSDFDAGEGPVAEWCNDPFWARYRFEDLQAQFEQEGRRVVVPVIFWLPRSSALNPGGSCSLGHDAPFTVAQWHASIAEALNGSVGLYGKWGVTFDYQLRTFEVPEDSPFVVDPDSDACRIGLSNVAADPNSVEALIEAFPNEFRPNELNAYLSDKSGVSWSTKAYPFGQKVTFLILSGDADAFAHEAGHALGLPHPYANNVSASGQLPDDAESRDSWLGRPFPDETLDRLAACAADADCEGVDAPPGVCRKAPGAANGFCQNLKRDCAEDGDHVCDTPWDAFPCFSGVDSLLGAACATDADCHTVSSNRGTSFLTACSLAGFCEKVACASNANCGGNSFCADGTCVIWKTGTEACCELHTDLQAGVDHNACYERRPNGSVVPVPGVGPDTTWPLHENVMTYHKPRGRPRSFTPGQRDQVVCKASYEEKWGPLLRLPNAAFEPCSLRPGHDVDDYGPAGETRRVAHGACASGVCQVVTTGFGQTVAFCTDSTCTDGIIGAGEASVDCGGVCPNLCPTNRSQSPKTSACFGDGDCVSGTCRMDVCQPTCEDNQQNGSEMAIDAGGQSFDATCAVQGTGGLCRFEQDCAGPLFCAGDAACVLDTDCPINAAVSACSSDADCSAGGTCLDLGLGFCAQPTCGQDAHCPSGVCRLPDGVCLCASDGNCPSPGNTCEVRAFCTDQCLDGRCLGRCELPM